MPALSLPGFGAGMALGRLSPRPRAASPAGAEPSQRLQVTIVGVSGVEALARDDAGVFCSCTVMGKAGTRFVTRRLQSTPMTFNHEATVSDFGPGDALLFGVWHADWRPLGSAVLEACHLGRGADFDLPLIEARSSARPVLRVQVRQLEAPLQSPATLGLKTSASSRQAPSPPAAGRVPEVPSTAAGIEFRSQDAVSDKLSQPPSEGLMGIITDEDLQELCGPAEGTSRRPMTQSQLFRAAKPGSSFQGHRGAPAPPWTPPPPTGSPSMLPGASKAASEVSGPPDQRPRVRPPPQQQQQQQQPDLPGLGCGGQPAAQPLSLEEQEDRDWVERQRRTGCVGRMVQYERWDCPQADFLLRGGCGRPIYVAQVTDGGRAHRMGVKAGDMLVSVDGRKDFQRQPGELLHASLIPPVTLVFMGFVGRPTAEVQLAIRDAPCGAPPATPVLGWSSPASPGTTLLDQITFQSSKPSTVLLATMLSGKHLGRKHRSLSPAVFELGRDDAVHVVRGALSPRSIEEGRRRQALRMGSPAASVRMPSMDGGRPPHAPASPSASRRPPSSAVRVAAPLHFPGCLAPDASALSQRAAQVLSELGEPTPSECGRTEPWSSPGRDVATPPRYESRSTDGADLDQLLGSAVAALGSPEVQRLRPGGGGGSPPLHRVESMHMPEPTRSTLPRRSPMAARARSPQASPGRPRTASWV